MEHSRRIRGNAYHERMTTPHLWQEAAAFAARAHRHQFRRDEKTPYVSHTLRVALTVACVFGCTDETILAAALLHDTIEDCDVDYDDLLERFGVEVADIVACVSKDMRIIEPRREEAYDRQLADGPWQARLIKLADVYDNMVDNREGDFSGKMLPKVRRALALAENDLELADARSIVASFAEQVEKEIKPAVE